MNLENLLGSIQTRAAEAPPLENTLKFDFGDGQLFIDGTGEKNVVSMEDKDADCTVTVSMENFKALISGQLNPMNAVFTGKVKISGNMGVAMKLQSLFSS